MTATPVFTVPTLYGYAAPEPDYIVADWQDQLDREFYRGPRGTRLLLRWESSEPWQALDRWLVWIAQDPRYVPTEPWIVKALHGPNPRSTGHYCAPGYCLCEENGEHPNWQRWIGGATRLLDSQTWRIFRETGLYATRFWVVQGSKGGHRYRWDKEELAAVVSQTMGHGDQPPAIGDLPYAPFDARALRALRAQHKADRAMQLIKKIAARKEYMALDERDEAERIARHLWDWTGKQAEDLWSQGGDAIPMVLEMEHGRAPIGHRIDYERQEAMTERWLTRPVE